MYNEPIVNKKEEKIITDIKQYYKYIYRCKKCKCLYGSDKIDKTLICVLCSKIHLNFKKKKKKKVKKISFILKLPGKRKWKK